MSLLQVMGPFLQRIGKLLAASRPFLKPLVQSIDKLQANLAEERKERPDSLLKPM